MEIFPKNSKQSFPFTLRISQSLGMMSMTSAYRSMFKVLTPSKLYDQDVIGYL